MTIFLMTTFKLVHRKLHYISYSDLRVDIFLQFPDLMPCEGLMHYMYIRHGLGEIFILEVLML